jgi:hypothetical protein
MHEIPPWIYITFTAVTAFGVLLQAAVLLGMLLAIKGALKRMNEISELAQEHAIPALASARRLLEEVGPKLKVASQNAVTVSQNAIKVTQAAVEISDTLKDQSTRLGVTVDHLREKTEIQAERVDEMVSGTLDSIANATAVLQRVVAGPIRQIGAVLNGLRAGFGVLREREPEHEVHSAADGDHFV